MLNDSLVAINIYNKKTNKLLNKSKFIPILFYWNGEGILEKSILTNKEFIENYINNIDISNNLINIYLSYFYFKYNENGEEEYVEYNSSLLDLINEYSEKTTKDLNNVYKGFIENSIIIKYFIKAYLVSFGEEYKIDKTQNQEKIIIDIYTKIKNKYKNKLRKDTIINWVRSELIKENDINNKNIEFIINIIENILQNQE